MKTPLSTILDDILRNTQDDVLRLIEEPKTTTKDLSILGFHYLYGWYVVNIDLKKALDYFEQSINEELSLFYCGFIYENGLGVEQDFAKALDYYHLLGQSLYSNINETSESIDIDGFIVSFCKKILFTNDKQFILNDKYGSCPFYSPNEQYDFSKFVGYTTKKLNVLDNVNVNDFTFNQLQVYLQYTFLHKIVVGLQSRARVMEILKIKNIRNNRNLDFENAVLSLIWGYNACGSFYNNEDLTELVYFATRDNNPFWLTYASERLYHKGHLQFADMIYRKIDKAQYTLADVFRKYFNFNDINNILKYDSFETCETKDKKLDNIYDGIEHLRFKIEYAQHDDIYAKRSIHYQSFPLNEETFLRVIPAYNDFIPFYRRKVIQSKNVCKICSEWINIVDRNRRNRPVRVNISPIQAPKTVPPRQIQQKNEKSQKQNSSENAELPKQVQISDNKSKSSIWQRFTKIFN